MSAPAERVRVPEVSQTERRLAELWREASSGDPAVTRSCTLNLVVVCGGGAGELASATELVARVTETEPGRALVVVPSGAAGEPAGLDVYVSAHFHRGSGGARACSEQVTLEPRGSALDLVPATILQLLVEDMPVYTYWRRPLIDDDPLLEPLLDLTDRWIVDSAAWPDPVPPLDALCRFAASGSRPGRLYDLTWARDEPWREALASFFDGPELRPCLERISLVAVDAVGPRTTRGATPAAAYVAGWLASRLGWKPAAAGTWRRPDGGPVTCELGRHAGAATGGLVSVKLEAALDREKTVRFAAVRAAAGSELVELAVTSPGSRPAPHRIKLPARDEAALLCGTLQRKRQDPVFEAALRDAARMA